MNLKSLIACCFINIHMIGAAIIPVTNNADAGAGSLRNALLTAVNGDIIQIAPNLTGGNTITLASNFPAINQSISIEGPASNSVTINGANSFQAFFVQSGTVSISNLNVSNAQSRGGQAGNYTVGGAGGGGLGAGAGLFVNNAANVSITNVNFSDNISVGGTAGQFQAPPNPTLELSGGSGGGGFHGNGGVGGMDSTVPRGGGGGGGLFLNGGNTVSATGGAGGGTQGGAGGNAIPNPQPGQPGNDFGAGGGGANTDLLPAGSGGNGGFGGAGGGGGSCHPGVTSGSGGTGGFGAGGGGSGATSTLAGTGGTSVFGGGTGGVGGSILTGQAGGGGGGAGLGGAIFVRQGGTLTINGFSFSGNNVAAGSGSGNGTNGTALGQDLFLMSGGTVTIDVEDSQTAVISSNIAGDGLNPGGGLNKTGTGNLVLNGNNTYTGTTSIQTGTLVVNGSILNTATVINPAGALAGTGFLGAVTNNGIVAPGNGGIGTIHMVSYVQNALGRVQYDISPTGAADLIEVSTTAQLNGGTLDVIAAPGFYVAGTTYNVITAGGGVTGQFGPLNLPSGLQGTLLYSTNVVQLRLLGNSFVTNETLRGNALRVANYLSRISIAQGSDLFFVLNSIDPNNLSRDLNELHPAQFQAFSLTNQNNMNAVRTVFTNRAEYLRRGFWCEDCDSCDPCASDLPSPWVAPFGEFVNESRRSELVGFRTTTGGILAGLDKRLNDCWVVGIGGGYSRTHLHWKSKFGRGSINSGYLGAYASWMHQNIYLDAAVLGDYDTYHAKRNINFVHRRARSHHTGFAVLGHIGGGSYFNWCDYILNPFFNVDYDFVRQNKFHEKGAQSINLHVRRNDANLWRTELGFTLSKCYSICGGYIQPKIRLSWVNQSIASGQKIFSSFQNIREDFFVKGTSKPLNQAAPGLAIEGRFGNFYLLLDYFAELSNRCCTQDASLTLQYTF